MTSMSPGTSGKPSGWYLGPLGSLDWQVHVYGTAGPDLHQLAERRGLPLFEFPWSERADAAGLVQNAAYLVRPDGHVSVAARAEPAAAIERVLDEYQISPAPASVHEAVPRV